MHVAKSRFAKSRFAKLQSIELHSAELHSAELHSAELHSAESHSVESHSAESQVAESRRQPDQTRRRGIVALEFLLAAPLMIILLLAVVQFGIFYYKMQQMSLACRAGARQAAQIDLTGAANGGPVPAVVIDAILAQLQQHGISACKILLEHNVQGASHQLESSFSSTPCDCQPPPAALLSGPAVRVTVCAALTELMPNALATLGLDVSGATASCTTTMRHDLTP